MQRNASLVRAFGTHGSVAVKKIAPASSAPLPRAPRWQPFPAGLSRAALFRSLQKEIAMRMRVAGKGLYRGIMEGSGVIGVSRLYATVIRANGTVEHLGLISTKLVTDTGVTFLRDDLNNNAQDITNMNFHACGTGTNAENQTDTALQTECTTVLNPASTRATGTRSTPASNQFRSVGTLTFSNTAAVTEHGLTSAATSTYVLWDRSVFSAINVVNGDSIQFTYTLTLSAGG